MLYGIRDQITGQWLTGYANGSDDWGTDEEKPRSIQSFETKEEVQKVVKELEAIYIKAGETDIDFQIVQVRKVTITYWEKDTGKR